MNITRVFAVIGILCLVLIGLSACPAPETADETPEGASTQAPSNANAPDFSSLDPTKPISSIGAISKSADDTSNDDATDDDENADNAPPVDDEEPVEPGEPEDARTQIISGEIAGIDLEANIIRLKIAGSSSDDAIEYPVADSYPKCLKCGMDMPVEVGDKGDFVLVALPDGNAAFAGPFCDGDCAEGGEPCEGCPRHNDQKKEA